MPGDEPGSQHSEIERLERGDIVAIQRRKLTALGRRLAARPEWVAHFARAGMQPQDLADPQALAALPTLEKSDLRALYPFPMLGVAMKDVVRFCATSGTTGPPVMYGFTTRDLRLLASQMGRVLRCAGFRSGDRNYQGYGYGMWIAGFSFDLGIQDIGATNFPIGPGRGEIGARWLSDLEITSCTMSPLWLARLAEIARSEGIDPKRDWCLRIAAVGGQSVSAAFYRHLEEQLPEGFCACNTYGTTEAGGPVIATYCSHSRDDDEMHLINEDTVLTEIVDTKTGKPAGPGEAGEIVVTTLDKEASPVVRWRTHDLVRVSDASRDCPCGRKGMPRIGPIIGRSDDMLKIRGVIVFPSQVEDVIASTEGLVKDAWQVYIDRKDRILEEATVAIERRGDAAVSKRELENRIGEALKGRLGIRFNVVCHEQGTLPRYEGKAQRVLLRE